MNGKIHSFQSLGTLDGPGVRFIVFMHGCNLHCGYCHNIDVCRGEWTEYSPQQVFERVIRYKSYFGSEGGITVSGGEPLLQADFVRELFTLCKNEGINTALDTSGSIFNSSVSSLLDCCDLVLLDIKMTDDESYRRYIGCGIDAPLRFLDELEKRGIDCRIRHVVTEGVNDDEDSILRLKKIIDSKACIRRTELLPFKKMCAQKYSDMNITFPFESFPETSASTIDKLNKLLK